MEDRAIKNIEKRYLTNRAGSSYIACEDFDFRWNKDELSEFSYLWQEGRSLQELAGYFQRQQEEILLLALDLGSRGKIKMRKGGLIGVIE